MIISHELFIILSELILFIGLATLINYLRGYLSGNSDDKKDAEKDAVFMVLLFAVFYLVILIPSSFLSHIFPESVLLNNSSGIFTSEGVHWLSKWAFWKELLLWLVLAILSLFGIFSIITTLQKTSEKEKSKEA